MIMPWEHEPGEPARPTSLEFTVILGIATPRRVEVIIPETHVTRADPSPEVEEE